MTTDPTDTVPAANDDEDQADDGADFAALIGELGRASEHLGDPGATPPPLAAGTFAVYPDGRGGVVMVMDVKEGAFPTGVHRGRIAPALIRAIGVLAGGGGKLAAMRALRGARRGRG